MSFVSPSQSRLRRSSRPSNRKSLPENHEIIVGLGLALGVRRILPKLYEEKNKPEKEEGNQAIGRYVPQKMRRENPSSGVRIDEIGYEEKRRYGSGKNGKGQRDESHCAQTLFLRIHEDKLEGFAVEINACVGQRE